MSVNKVNSKYVATFKLVFIEQWVSKSRFSNRIDGQLKLGSLKGNYRAEFTYFILSEITTVTSVFEIHIRFFEIPINFKLADNDFNKL